VVIVSMCLAESEEGGIVMRTLKTFLLATMFVGCLVPGSSLAATEIVYWDFIKPGDGTPRGDALAKNLERFQAKYPDIRVKVEVVPPSSIDPNLIQGAAAGSTPDVVRVYNYLLPLHVSAGSVQPLDKFAEKADKTDWLLPWNSTVFDGKKYALPYEYRFFALLYRKDILDKAGVQVPTTWDEVCKAGGKINSPQVMGYAFGLSQANSAYALLEWTEDMIAAAGSQMFDDKSRAIFINAAGRKFFQTIPDLVGKCKASGPAVAEFTYNHIDEGLKAGTIAMAGLGTHRYLAIRSGGAGDNLRWAPLPGYEKGKLSPVYINGWTLVMGKHAKNPDAAGKFMEFMTSPETQVIVARAGEMPTRKSTYKDAWFKSPDAKFMDDWATYVGKNGQSGRYPVGWFDFGQILAEGTQSIVLKGVASEKALAAVVEKYNKSLEGKK
jgi:multiple sugar transport system substrate-binding protein